MSFSTFRVLLGACVYSLSVLCASSFRLVYILPFVFAHSFPFRLCSVMHPFPLFKALLSGREVTVFFSVTIIVTVIVLRARCARVKYYNVYLLFPASTGVEKLCFVTYL